MVETDTESPEGNVWRKEARKKKHTLRLKNMEKYRLPQVSVPG